MTVLVIVPVLRRPHNAAPLAASLDVATPEPHRLLFVASPGDTEEHEACRATGADLLIIDREPGPGDYMVKINTAYRASTEELIFLAADDLSFHRGWLPPLLRKVDQGFGVIGTNDLGNPRVLRGEHSTHSLVTRIYADTFGTIDGPGILHEGYDHNFCDTEMVETAKHRGAWAFCSDSVVEHMHPHWSKSQDDDTYRRGQRRFGRDRSLFEGRRHQWT